MTGFYLRRLLDVLPLSLVLIGVALVVWLPGGNHIAYVALDTTAETSTVRLIDIERGLRTDLFTMSGRIDALSWSPDGETLYFGAFRTESAGRDLAALDVRSGAFRWLTDFPPDNNVPVPSPDGSLLAFQHLTDDSWDVYLLDLRTGETRPVLATPFTEGHPVWRDDGTLLVEMLDSHGTCLIDVEIDSGVWETVACGEADGLVWSPDERFTVFDLYRNGTLDLYTGDALGGNPVRFTDMGGFAYAPDWSPDGRYIVFVHATAAGVLDALYIRDMLDSTPTRLTPNEATHLSPVWRP